jgi:hypothetical protein
MSIINWIFDIYQHSKIDEARNEAAAARAEVASLRHRGGDNDSGRVADAVGELALATKTLQRILVQKGVCDLNELSALMHQIDLEDGQADGKAPIH